MTTRHLVDRQIAPLLNMFPQVELAGSLIAEVREKADAAYAFLPPPAITPEVMTISSAHGGPDIAVYLYRPSATKPGSGAILYIHGGGMVMGSARRIQTSPATLAASMRRTRRIGRISPGARTSLPRAAGGLPFGAGVARGTGRGARFRREPDNCRGRERGRRSGGGAGDHGARPRRAA